MGAIIQHPFKEAVKNMLRIHFGDKIADSFRLSFEADHISTDASIAIAMQVKSGNMVLEVRYANPDNTQEFICDLYSWSTKREIEAKLLRYITDAYKEGKIRDWVGHDGYVEKSKAKLINKDIISGKYETPDSLVQEGMVKQNIDLVLPKGGGKK